LRFSSAWRNYLLLGHPLGLFCLNLNSDVHFSIIVVSILFMWPKHFNNFSLLTMLTNFGFQLILKKFHF
jgi:hypothetical protein